MLNWSRITTRAVYLSVMNSFKQLNPPIYSHSEIHVAYKELHCGGPNVGFAMPVSSTCSKSCQSLSWRHCGVNTGDQWSEAMAVVLSGNTWSCSHWEGNSMMWRHLRLYHSPRDDSQYKPISPAYVCCQVDPLWHKVDWDGAKQTRD